MAAARNKILIAEDDKNIVKLLEYNLKEAGFSVTVVNDGESAVRKVEEDRPSLLLLDLMLPGISGISVCRKLRQGEDTRDLPIIVLTAKSDEMDKISGLEAGADDYVTKPFSPEELILRIGAVLKRQDPGKKKQILKMGKIVLDEEKHEVKAGGKELDLTVTEFKLLKHFLENKGKLLTRDALLSNVWGYDSYIDTRTVDTHVKTIRRKLAKTGVKIVTVRGMGYKLEE